MSKVVRAKKRVVTDGPYAEAKDLLLGLIVIEARDLAQAVERPNEWLTRTVRRSRRFTL